MVRPPVDVLGVASAVHDAEATLVGIGAVPSSSRMPCVDLVTKGLLIVLGDSEQHPDDPHRHLGRQVVDEVESALCHERVQGPGAEPPHLRLDLGHPPGREHPASRLRCTSCAGGSSNRMMPGGISMPLQMSSSTDPLPEMYVFQSAMHSRTSSKRLSAKKSCRSL